MNPIPEYHYGGEALKQLHRTEKTNNNTYRRLLEYIVIFQDNYKVLNTLLRGMAIPQSKELSEEEYLQLSKSRGITPT